MSDASAAKSPAETTAETTEEPKARRRWFSTDLELVIVILLGLVSLATAFTSFEASLYGGNQASAYAKGNSQRTEAESLYLEANQQFTQDAQTIAQLAVLNVAWNNGDAIAGAQYDELYFIAVSPALDEAIQAARQLDIDDPDFWHDPQADEAYQQALFGAYGERLDEATVLLEQGDEYNTFGDRLTLNTVLMAITLFLLGVAAVVRRPQMKIILTIVGMSIFVVAAIMTLTIPFIWIG